MLVSEPILESFFSIFSRLNCQARVPFVISHIRLFLAMDPTQRAELTALKETARRCRDEKVVAVNTVEAALLELQANIGADEMERNRIQLALTAAFANQTAADRNLIEAMEAVENYLLNSKKLKKKLRI